MVRLPMFQIEVPPPVHLYKLTGLPMFVGGGGCQGFLSNRRSKVYGIRLPREGFFLFFCVLRLQTSLPKSFNPSCLLEFNSSCSASSHHSKIRSLTLQSPGLRRRVAPL